MIQAVIFDADGMVVVNELRFSEHWEKSGGPPTDITRPFFEHEFQNCLIGKADLKKELVKYVDKWGYTNSVDDLLDYWFSIENNPDNELIEYIRRLRGEGLPCYLATNQERYRTEYFLDTMGFRHEFDDIFSSAYIGFKKPQYEFFEAVMEELPKGTAKHEVLFWDDDEKHVAGAKQFGLLAELYTGFEDFKEKMSSYL